jgi:hypothetical protein
VSVLKYGYDRGGQSDQQLQFGRARADGMPFRGPSLPLKDEEWEQFTEQVNDFGHGMFDMSKPDDARQVKEVCDRAGNGWYQVMAYDRHLIQKPDGTHTILIYLSWLAPHRELARDRVNAAMPLPVTYPITAARAG